MSRNLYIIGAGIAGLTAAHYAAKNYDNIEIFEASPYAGGRCRSFYDNNLKCEINNGNHLVLQCNKNFINLIKDLNIENNFNYYSKKPKIFFKNKFDNFKLISESIFNTEFKKIDKIFLLKTYLKILFSGSNFNYLLPKENWKKSFIEPLSKNKRIHHNKAVKEVLFDNEVAQKILFFDGGKIVCKNDMVIIAAPPYSASKLTNKEFNFEYSPIINIHFLIKENFNQNIMGITNSVVDWIFCNGNIISTTKSAANKYLELSEELLIEKSWDIIRKKLNLENYLSAKVIIEKRATFTATKNNLRNRPKNNTGFKNLFICGDYTDTELPATIEGALISALSSVKML